METREAPAEHRPARLWMVGLSLLKRPPECKCKCKCEREEQPGIFVWPEVERVVKLILIVVGLGLSGLACFLFAIPHFPGGVRPFSNESAAIATLRNIATAQAEFQSHTQLDRDADGIGEFGSFAELAAASGSHPPRLSPSFARARSLPGGGRVIQRAGYIFQLFVPRRDTAISDANTPGVATPTPDPSETRWCCYAWPAMLHNTGKRVFFIDHSGVVLMTRNRRRHYSGIDSSPVIDAAFARRARAGMNSSAAVDTTGRDGQVWNVVR